MATGDAFSPYTEARDKPWLGPESVHGPRLRWRWERQYSSVPRSARLMQFVASRRTPVKLDDPIRIE